MQVSIVIPIYNALPLARKCVASLYEHGSTLSFEVIVVDNGSAPDVEEWLRQQAAAHDNLRFLRYPEPLGFARSVNAGAAQATGEVLIVLNSDTIMTAGWMEGLHQALLDDPSLGALTPTTNHAGEPAQMDFSTADLSAAKALAKAAKRDRTPDMLYLPQRLTFFCVALRRAVWLEFDGLDEAYKVGNFEDDDLCLRLRVAGYRLGVARHVYVYHHNNATFLANRISHSGWMGENAATFAGRARRISEAAEDRDAAVLKRPRRSGRDITVIVLPSELPAAERAAALDRTLRSLAHQTVLDFEVIPPGSPVHPHGSWLAYVTEGDILYPFHLEALHDALERTGSEAIFADGWIMGASRAAAHPDTAAWIRKVPLLLSGWMHHASLNRDLLWEESVPMHWPRLTWEMQKWPDLPADTPPVPLKPRPSVVGAARRVYRRILPLETRHRLDRGVRKVLRRPLPIVEQVQMQQLTAHLEQQCDAGTDAGKFATASELPAVFMFNAVSWNDVTQRQQHFARGLAERGHPVFWLEPAFSPLRSWRTSRPLQQLASGVHMVRLPAATRDVYSVEWNDDVIALMTAALRYTASVYGLGNPVQLINYPRYQPLVARLQERLGWKLASDTLDDQRALAALYSTILGPFEDRLEAGADLLLTSSVIMQERLMPRPSVLLHNAADFDLFSCTTPAGHLQHLPRPIIGFFGALADWLDVDLIHAAAERFPKWTFVYIGPHIFSRTETQVAWIRQTDLPNIVVLPKKDPRDLAAHLAEFDVCTMPFLDIPVTRSMNPVKIYEYLAAGKPCISRDLPEVRHLLEGGAAGLVSLYRTPLEFFERLETAVAEDDPALRERRQVFARQNDWSYRIDTLSALLTELGRRSTPAEPR